jgi:putative NADH-flavin reductase
VRVLVLGANGRTGRHVVSAAAAAGHEVTAFVRCMEGLPDIGDAALRVVQGDIAGGPEGLAEVLPGHDVVISALGNGLSPRDGRTPKIVGAATRNLVDAMTRRGVRRVVTMLSYGAGATTAHAPWYVRVLARTALRADFADLSAADEALAASDLAWTVAHFGSLADGPATGACVTSDLGRPRSYRVSRADVAACLLALADSDALIHQRVVLDGALVRGDGRLIVHARLATDDAPSGTRGRE